MLLSPLTYIKHSASVPTPIRITVRSTLRLTLHRAHAGYYVPHMDLYVYALDSCPFFVALVICVPWAATRLLILKIQTSEWHWHNILYVYPPTGKPDINHYYALRFFQVIVSDVYRTDCVLAIDCYGNATDAGVAQKGNTHLIFLLKEICLKQGLMINFPATPASGNHAQAVLSFVVQDRSSSQLPWIHPCKSQVLGK